MLNEEIFKTSIYIFRNLFEAHWYLMSRVLAICNLNLLFKIFNTYPFLPGHHCPFFHCSLSDFL